jgi:CheY-like chemotaxis protein
VEGLQALRAADFDLVLMDVNMPVMGGVEALQALRRGEAGRPDLPVIALTADAMAGDRDRYLAAGFDDHLGKPIQLEQLVTAISRVLEPSSSSAERAA